jgi:hypothetical protein
MIKGWTIMGVTTVEVITVVGIMVTGMTTVEMIWVGAFRSVQMRI